MYRLFVAGLLALLLAIGPIFPGEARAQGKPSEGIDYLTLKHPQPVDPAGTIDVIEFFWYGCPHCYALEPVIHPWIKSLPPDTRFRRVPAVFNESWAVAARVFYTFESLRITERVHRPFFDAIHRGGLNIVAVRDKVPVLNEPAVREWLTGQAVDGEKFMTIYRSFGVESSVRRATQLTQAYGIDGVPALGVQGRYMVSATMSGDRATLLAVTDYLINASREELATGAGNR